jgi:hypothetical protein
MANRGHYKIERTSVNSFRYQQLESYLAAVVPAYAAGRPTASPSGVLAGTQAGHRRSSRRDAFPKKHIVPALAPVVRQQTIFTM